MTITTIRDTLRAFAQSLQISTSFPAALLVVMNLYFILPAFFDYELDAVTTFSMTVSAALLISYILYAFNFPMIRLLEGYKCRKCSWNRWLASLQAKAYIAVVDNLNEADADRKYYESLLEFDPIDPGANHRQENLTSEDRDNYQGWRAGHCPQQHAALSA